MIAFLRDPATHGVAPGELRVIETHCAMVFLAGDRAYKMKKAVKLPYLDFSTLEKRRRACRRELEINRRTAPDIYIDAAPVTRSPNGALSLRKGGETVEWVVVMRRFPDDCILSHAAKLAALDESFLDRLATSVAHFHKGLEPGPRRHGARRARTVADDVIRSLQGAPDLIAPDRVETLSRGAGIAFRSAARVLDFRAQIGMVRRCHGDLHLGNIVDIGGTPVPFDALEFDEELATTDVLYDLAFLLMDLDERGRRAVANRLLNQYLASAGSTANFYGLAALPLFLACRAAIRAMVTVDRLRQQPSGADTALREPIDRLVTYALSYLDESPPSLVGVGGLSGSGKTTLARALAPLLGRAPGAVLLRSDVERKAIFGVSDDTRLPAAAYTHETNRIVYRRLLRRARLCLCAGHSVIVDAVHSKPHERSELQKLARQYRAGFAGIWLQADRAALIARIEKRLAGPPDASDATPDVVRVQLKRDIGPVDWTIVDAGGDTGKTLRQASRTLGAKLSGFDRHEPGR